MWRKASLWRTFDILKKYGGGGIYPDVVLPEPDPAPLWLERAREADLPLKWVGGYLTAAGTALSSLDSLAAHPLLPAGARP